MSSTTPERDLGPLAHYARLRGVSERTVRRWVGLGYFPGYRAKGVRGLIIDRVEADRALAALPEGAIKPEQASYGPKADIRDLDVAR